MTDKHPVRTVTAHPRSRGENVMCFFAPSAVQGSSPLTRGKLSLLGVVLRSVGLIPAHAGKTLITSAANSTVRAHPRSRGENTRYWCVTSRRGGSSPLTRGKHTQASQRRAYPGLIPAHAGKTAQGAATPSRKPAHPRSRGENYRSSSACRSEEGSSPLTRGKPVPCVPQNAWRGLIPAHAGKTWWSRSGRTCRRAHPRSRGENHSTLRLTSPSLGSSPLTRGKRCRALCPFARSGLIPAHAGKTDLDEPETVQDWAHPRSRGENVIVPSFVPTAAGSSPLTRGKLRKRLERELWRGLIPAHAGKTEGLAAHHPCQGAHPRSRGENRRTRTCVRHPLGSSPLTRGKRCRMVRF